MPDYVGDYVYIRNESPHKYQAFVSNYSKGNDEWFDLTDSFTDDSKWSRSGWEVVAIRNAEDTARKGYYVHIKGQTVYVTIKSIENIVVEICPKPDE